MLRKKTLAAIAGTIGVLVLTAPALADHTALQDGTPFQPPQKLELQNVGQNQMQSMSCQDLYNVLIGTEYPPAVTGLPVSARPGFGFAELLVTSAAPGYHDTGPLDIGGGQYETFGVYSEGSGSNIFIADTTVVGPGRNFSDAPGYEFAAISSSQKTWIWYKTNMYHELLGIPPGPGSSNPKFKVCWVLGPCALPNETALANTCNNYNTTWDDGSGGALRIVDMIVGKTSQHFTGQNYGNICGCEPVRATWCSDSAPDGASNSCNPENAAVSGFQPNIPITYGPGSFTLLTTTGGTKSSTGDPSCPSGSTGTYPDCTCTTSGYSYDQASNQCIGSSTFTW